MSRTDPIRLGSGDPGVPGAEWTGWWGPNPPYHHQVFVLTHHAHDPIEMEGGTTFHFVTDGIESALEQATAAAGGADVAIGGGASTVRQYLRADVIDWLHVPVVPVLLGGGERLFENPAELAGYHCTEYRPSPAVSHMIIEKRYETVRSTAPDAVERTDGPRMTVRSCWIASVVAQVRPPARRLPLRPQRSTTVRSRASCIHDPLRPA